MTYEAITLSFTTPAGNQRAFALLCAGARYASVLLVNGDRIDRVHLAAGLWREIEHEISVGLPAKALPEGSALQKALAGAEWRSVVVSYLHRLPIEIEKPEDAAE